MKKHISELILLLVFCVLLLTGCKKDVGTPEDNAINSNTNKEDEITYTFGYSCITMENPYFVTLEEAIREQVEKEGNTLITRDPALDVQVQIEQIKDMISQGIDAIFLTPVDWQAIQPAIDALKEADVKIINIDTQISDVGSVDSYIGTDNKTAGFICGQDLVEKHPDGGK
ncbi:MAG: substrate-binding domain-containing protein, partial [Lachnospiraceae bacterium]